MDRRLHVVLPFFVYDLHAWCSNQVRPQVAGISLESAGTAQSFFYHITREQQSVQSERVRKILCSCGVVDFENCGHSRGYYAYVYGLCCQMHSAQSAGWNALIMQDERADVCKCTIDFHLRRKANDMYNAYASAMCDLAPCSILYGPPQLIWWRTACL